MATMQHPAFYHQEHDGRVGSRKYTERWRNKVDAYDHKANSMYARDLVRGGSSREADQKLNKQADCASQYKHKYDVLGMSLCGVRIPARSTNLQGG